MKWNETQTPNVLDRLTQFPRHHHKHMKKLCLHLTYHYQLIMHHRTADLKSETNQRRMWWRKVSNITIRYQLQLDSPAARWPHGCFCFVFKRWTLSLMSMWTFLKMNQEELWARLSWGEVVASSSLRRQRRVCFLYLAPKFVWLICMVLSWTISNPGGRGQMLLCCFFCLFVVTHNKEFRIKWNQLRRVLCSQAEKWAGKIQWLKKSKTKRAQELLWWFGTVGDHDYVWVGVSYVVWYVFSS